MRSRDPRYRRSLSPGDLRDEHSRMTRRKRHDSIEGERDKYSHGQDKRRRTRSPPSRSSHHHHHHEYAKDISHQSYRNNDSRKGSSHLSGKRASSPTTQKKKSLGAPLPPQSVSFHASNGRLNTLAVVNGKPEKQKPNFAPTGLLAAASNSVLQADGSAITLKYHEPPEARKPLERDEWRLYVFKDSKILETIELNTKSSWLVGREAAVVDIIAEHPSISKQHAVIQFRFITKAKDAYSLEKTGRIRPYVIDLDSSNGTILNKELVPKQRFLELRDKDMIHFGHSTREYVLILSAKTTQ